MKAYMQYVEFLINRYNTVDGDFFEAIKNNNSGRVMQYAKKIIIFSNFNFPVYRVYEARA